MKSLLSRPDDLNLNHGSTPLSRKENVVEHHDLSSGRDEI